MNSISCFIIDDQPSIELLSDFIITISRLKLKGSALNTLAALNFFLATSYPDVLFINVDLFKDFNLNLYEYILKHQILIIVTSAVKDNAFQAFEIGFFDYILKPVSYERFLKTVSRIINFRSYLKERNCFYIQSETKGKIIKIVHDEIQFIEANQNYVNIFIDNGNHITYQTMKIIEQRLPANRFIRVHKSFIVNEEKIYSVNNDYVILNDKKTVIKIGSSYRKNLLNRLLPGF